MPLPGSLAALTGVGVAEFAGDVAPAKDSPTSLARWPVLLPGGLVAMVGAENEADGQADSLEIARRFGWGLGSSAAMTGVQHLCIESCMLCASLASMHNNTQPIIILTTIVNCVVLVSRYPLVLSFLMALLAFL